MATRLRYLPISDVIEGMVLGAPLAVAENGVTSFTLPAGHVLTDSNLRQMALRHAEYACIELPDLRSEEERQSDIAELTARLDRIFAPADRSEPVVSGLYAAVLNYRSM